MRKYLFSIPCFAAFFALAFFAVPRASAEEGTFDVGAGETKSVTVDDNYSNVTVANNGKLTIESDAGIGSQTSIVQSGTRLDRWSDNGKFIKGGEIDNLTTYKTTGTLTQTGRSASTTNNGYIGSAEIQGGSLTNRSSIDFVTVNGANASITNEAGGSIGIFSTAINNRYGGLTLYNGFVSNEGYISKVDMYGGVMDNYYRIAELELKGGDVANYDKIIYAEVSAGVLHNDNYTKADGFPTGGATDTVVLSGTGKVINDNKVVNLFMSGGIFEQWDTRGKALDNAEISGGEFLGNGLVGDMLLQTDGVLNTSSFTGEIENLSFESTELGERGGKVEFAVNGEENSEGKIIGDVLNQLNITGSFTATDAIISVVFDSAFAAEWQCFNLADLINFSDTADTLVNWKDATYEFNNLGAWGWYDESDLYSGWIINPNRSAEEIELIRLDIMRLNTATTPEPGTMCAIGLATLLGIPALRRTRKSRNRT